jgi:hypothetical protein
VLGSEGWSAVKLVRHVVCCWVKSYLVDLVELLGTGMIRMVQLRKLLSSFQGDIPIYSISSPCGDSYYAGLKCGANNGAL